MVLSVADRIDAPCRTAPCPCAPVVVTVPASKVMRLPLPSASRPKALPPLVCTVLRVAWMAVAACPAPV